MSAKPKKLRIKWTLFQKAKRDGRVKGISKKSYFNRVVDNGRTVEIKLFND